MGDETVVSVSHYVQWSDVYDIEKNKNLNIFQRSHMSYKRKHQKN
jgi:hypothetical protein